MKTKQIRPISENPLLTRQDVRDALEQICSPLKPYYSDGKARLRLGPTNTNYGRKRSEVESFARPFWGLVPLAAGGGDSDLLAYCREGLVNGTNPSHPEYWGELTDIDQLAVEMPPLALGIALSPETFWEPIDSTSQKRILQWLDQINQREVSDNNWRFFPVLVNASLKKAGLPYNDEVMERGLQRVEDFYLGGGWYSDGTGDRMDYYVPFAIHFYSLIYAGMMEDVDPDRSKIFKSRAAEFAKDYSHWFTADGKALPFGRSLTYRFAQGAFWAALAFANVEAIPWGCIKGLYLRHLRYWFSQPIFDSGGILSIGYTYPNLTMSEFYNGPGSSYWALKAFLAIALPDDHPFWLAKEQEQPDAPQSVTQDKAMMLISSSETRDHVVALTSGQWCGLDFGHTAAKYSKFAYSTHFGFSVPRESVSLQKGAFDSMLAVSDGGDNWRVRRKCESVKISENKIVSVWKPWDNVRIVTTLIDCYPWHVRIHEIETWRTLKTAEGGFAQPVDESADFDDAIADSNGAIIGGSGIYNIDGNRVGELIETMPNSNLIHPRTVIPTLVGEIKPGAHTLICAVLGEVTSDRAKAAWSNPPSIGKPVVPAEDVKPCATPV